MMINKMNFMKNFWSILLTLGLSVFGLSVVFAQGTTCATANPFCGSTSYSFPASGPSAPSGPNYGCMQTQPNAIWYYMEASTAGTMGLTIGGNNLDVDFAMWGPFSDQASGCTSVMGGVNPIQSSYSSSTTENIGIGMSGGSNSICASGQTAYGATTPPAAQTGQVYIVLISNYSTSSGNITFNQTSGTGSTNCAIVTPPTGCGIDNLTATAVCNGTNATISGSLDVATTITTGTLTVSSSCGGSQVFNAPFPVTSAGLTYSFNGGAGDGSSCTVTAVFSDDASCTATTSVTKPNCGCSLTLTPASATICLGGTTTLTANETGGTWAISDTTVATVNNGVVTSVGNGTASVTYTNGSCTATTQIVVASQVTPQFTNPGPICSGASLSLPTTSTNGITGTWSPAVDNTQTTTYTFTADAGQCAPDITMTVVVNEAPVITANPMHQTICSGEWIDVSVTADVQGTTYGWTAVPSDSVTGAKNGTGNYIRDTLFYTGTTSGTVTYAIIGSKDGCYSQPVYVTVTVNPAPATSSTVTVTATDVVVEEGNSTNLNATMSPYIPGVIYTWTPPQTLNCTDCPNPIATPVGDTWYTVKLTTPQGCNMSDSIFIKYKIKCGETYIPNVFSPNGDGYNEIFKVYSRCMTGIQLTIYDRWGGKVFYTDDITHWWDGTKNGTPMNTGVYVYRATVTLLDGTKEELKGNVTLVR